MFISGNIVGRYPKNIYSLSGIKYIIFQHNVMFLTYSGKYMLPSLSVP